MASWVAISHHGDAAAERLLDELEWRAGIDGTSVVGARIYRCIDTEDWVEAAEDLELTLDRLAPDWRRRLALDSGELARVR